jgi:ectoine hydroxylase-related dioxygenase (phytanoyl-CoA dioxygenase family)
MSGTTTGLRPHPWNDGFTWTSPSGPFSVLSAAQAEQFDRDGFVVLEDVFERSLVESVAAEADVWEAKVEGWLRRQEGERAMIAEAGAITFTTFLVTRSPVLRAFAAHSVLAGLALDLVGPDVRLYHDQAVYKKPEKPRPFPWHQDNGYAFVSPQAYLTCWVPLTDATAENGCPQVVPGLHRGGTLAHEYVEPLGFQCLSSPPGAVAAPVRAGGVVVFSSLTPHLTGPNLTADVRKAYILQYAPEGAVVLEGDPATGPPTGRRPCQDPDRQFPVVRDGRPVAA